MLDVKFEFDVKFGLFVFVFLVKVMVVNYLFGKINRLIIVVNGMC